jgi:hypothetical protein
MFAELFVHSVYFLLAQMVPKLALMCQQMVLVALNKKGPNFLLLVLVFIMLMFSGCICDTEVLFYAYSFL